MRIFIKESNNLIVGFGAPAKATTALNFFGVTNEIDYIVEDNKLKHNKFVPGVKIPIKKKSQIKNKKNTILVLAWNFFHDIKKNNSILSNNFVNINAKPILFIIYFIQLVAVIVNIFRYENI